VHATLTFKIIIGAVLHKMLVKS